MPLFLLWCQGVVDVLCQACDQMKWKQPSKIQCEAIPVSLEGVMLLIVRTYNLCNYFFNFSCDLNFPVQLKFALPEKRVCEPLEVIFNI